MAHLDRSVLGAAARLARATGVLTTAELLRAAIEGVPELSAWWAASGAARLQGLAGLEEDSPTPHLPGPHGGVVFDRPAAQALGALGTWEPPPAEGAGAAALVVVLLDQASTEVTELLRRAGVDARALRTRALQALGLGAEHPALELELPEPPAAMTIAGWRTLPVSALDPEAWAACRRRQAKLPLHRLHRRADVAAMGLNEQHALERLADRLGLDDHERVSLRQHHLDEVYGLGATVVPGLDDPKPPLGRPDRPIAGWVPARDRQRRRFVPQGWCCWIGNRNVNWRARWLRLAGQH